jgi:hypothetical protein
MTGLLTILILLGITIAIWQMVKIFDLAQANRDTSQVANDKDNSINAYLMLAFLGFIYFITIISFVLWGQLPSFYCTILHLSTREKKAERPFFMLIMISWNLYGLLFQ